jgi:hypothetical protein
MSSNRVNWEAAVDGLASQTATGGIAFAPNVPDELTPERCRWPSIVILDPVGGGGSILVGA